MQSFSRERYLRFVPLAVTRDDADVFYLTDPAAKNTLALNHREWLAADMMHRGRGLRAAQDALTALYPRFDWSEEFFQRVAARLAKAGMAFLVEPPLQETQPSYLSAPRMARWWNAGFGIGLLSLGAALWLATRGAWPSSDDFFWSDSLLLSMTTGYAVGWLLLFKHEAAHFLAARAAGLKPSLRLANRWFFLVIETHVPAIYQVPEKERRAIYLAGLAADAMALAGLMAAGSWGDGALGAFARQAALVQLLAMLWQGFIFFRTDFYYLLADWMDFENLSAAAKRYAKGLWHRLNDPSFRDVPLVVPHRRAVQTYALFSLLTGAVVLWRSFAYALPIALTVVVRATRVIAEGNYDAEYAGAVVALAVQAGHFALVLAAWRAERRRKDERLPPRMIREHF